MRHRGRAVAGAAAAIAIGSSVLVAARPALGVEVAAPAIAAQSDRAAWTVLLYTDADNNIEAELLATLEQAALVGSTDDLNIISLVDRSPEDNDHGPGARDGNLGSIRNFADAKLLRVDRGDFTELDDMGEIDMGDPQTLAWFVATGIQQFPAQHYGLILQNHGGGISGYGWDDSTPLDASHNTSNLTIPEISDALDVALGATGVAKLDFLGYHACLMATYDAAVDVAPFAHWLISSEELMTGPEWDYEASLGLLADAPSSTGQDFGEAVADHAVAANRNDPTTTLSVLDLTRVGLVRQALESFAGTLEDEMPDVASELGRERAQSLAFGVDPSGSFDAGLVDLGDLARRLDGLPPRVETARNSLFTALDNLVVANATGAAATAATGLSIYFPASARERDPRFADLPTSRAWSGMLDAYYRLATSQPSGRPTFESPEADVDVDSQGVLASATLTSGTESSVVVAEFVGGLVQRDGSVHHVVLSPAVIGAGGPRVVAGGWDFSYLQLSDGDVTLEATLVLDPVAGGLRATVPLLYQAANGTQDDAVLNFTIFDNGTLSDLALTRYERDGGASELVPEEGSLLAPLVLVSPPGGSPSYELLTDTALDASSPELSVAGTFLPRGSTFSVVLLAADATGATAVASNTGRVP